MKLPLNWFGLWKKYRHLSAEEMKATIALADAETVAQLRRGLVRDPFGYGLAVRSRKLKKANEWREWIDDHERSLEAGRRPLVDSRTPELELLGSEAVRAIGTGLRQLDTTKALVILLRVLGVEPKTIADFLGVDRPAVYNALYRGKAELEAALQSKGGA